MRIFPLTFCLTAFVAAVPVTDVRDNSPTIWAQSTIPAMKASINTLYEASLQLYNERGFLLEPHAPCQAPPTGSQTNDTVCGRADKMASDAQNLVSQAFHDLASAMFPVTYGLPDSKNETRATYSDFSHFWNYLMIEVSTLTNITNYYSCLGNLRFRSLTYNASEIANFIEDDQTVILFGPNTHSHKQADNGTLWEPDGFAKGRFYESWNPNWDRMEDSYDYGQSVQLSPHSKFSVKYCLEAKLHGVRKPTPPKNLPPRHLTTRRPKV